ncbi:AAA family ATPase [Vibrio splendidus]
MSPDFDLLFVPKPSTSAALYNSLTTIKYDHLPSFLPESNEALEECLVAAKELALIEAERVVSDYQNFDWDKLLRENPQVHRENREFLSKYENRIAYIHEAMENVSQFELFDKLRLLNFLSLECHRVLYDYRAFDWNDLNVSHPQAFVENRDFFIKYQQRCREISLEARSTNFLDKLPNHLEGLTNSMKVKHERFQVPQRCNNNNKTAYLIKADMSLDTSILELNQMIGLSKVKSRVQALANEISIRKEREKRGIKTNSRSYHMLFTGNAGTGKTVVARILADIFYSLGVTRTNTLVEATRSDLVGTHIGQTAPLTNALVDKAMGGVLFIDEAYTLNGKAPDFGPEAIATLLKRMEDERDDLIIIMAGYGEEIAELMQSNQGLESRFSRTIAFEDYDLNELTAILKSFIKQNSYELCGEVTDSVLEAMIDERRRTMSKFANARTVRNIFEQVVELQEQRLFQSGELPRLSSNELQLITLSDILSVSRD